MPAFIDLTGKRFGRLVAISREGISKHEKITWRCKCDCGGVLITDGQSLRRGDTASCGCLRREVTAAQSQIAGLARGKQMQKHGKAGTRLYNIWKAMRERCNNPNDRYYADYGGREISVCQEWHDFQAFYDWAMANGYNPDAAFGECTIDRIDVNGNYEPLNCRWVTMKVQASNKRNSRKGVVN